MSALRVALVLLAAVLAAGVSHAEKTVVILVIGDGMGPDSIALAEEHAGRELTMRALPHRGTLRVSSTDGDYVDSAATGTTMATGVITKNDAVGVDAQGVARLNVLELATLNGLSTGIVTTDAVSGATPAAFSAHVASREEKPTIVWQQGFVTRPDVLLGGGDRHRATFVAAGIRPVSSARHLHRLAGRTDRLWGLFAWGRLPFARERRDVSFVPGLDEMTRAALVTLDRDPDGFVLVVEGALIDKAAHKGLADDLVTEILELDGVVGMLREWASDREDVLLIVTADHTCPLETEDHTMDPVDVFALGPGSERFDGVLLDLRAVHRAIVERIAR